MQLRRCMRTLCVRVDRQFSSDEFNTKVGVHQGAVMSPLLFIIVMEALSREFRVGCPLGIALRRRSGVNGRNIRGLEKEAHNLER